MSTERIYKALANCEQGLSSSEQAQARENIGAQGALTAGSNITIAGDTISATDTTYGVFSTSADGLVPKASGTGDTSKFLKGDGTWEAVPQSGSVVKKIDYGESSASTVSTLLIDSDDPENYSAIKADGSIKGYLVQGPYKTLVDSGINGGSGVGDASTPIYVDTDGTFKAGNAVVNGGKHSHTAELYHHHYDSDYGDVYHVRNVANYCINHVVVANHSSDICSIVIEAPTLGTNEEYDYYVAFDCTNSSGGCYVEVQNCDAEIVDFPYYDPNGPQGLPIVAFQDITKTYVGFSGSPRYHVEVIGGRYTVHRF